MVNNDKNINSEINSIHSPLLMIGGWLVTSYDMLVAWLGSYSLITNVFLFIPLWIHPVVVGIGIFSGLLAALMAIGNNIGDIKKVTGIHLLPIYRSKDNFLNFIAQTKTHYENILHVLKKEVLTQEQLTLLLHKVKTLNTDIRVLQNTADNHTPSRAFQIIKYAVLSLMSVLQFGGGFLLAKGVVALLGIAILPSPLGVIGLIAGSISLAAFLLVKRHALIGNLKQLFGYPEPMPEQDLLFIKNGLSVVERKLSVAIQKKIANSTTVTTSSNSTANPNNFIKANRANSFIQRQRCKIRKHHYPHIKKTIYANLFQSDLKSLSRLKIRPDEISSKSLSQL
jgi:hypothetical protein